MLSPRNVYIITEVKGDLLKYLVTDLFIILDTVGPFDNLFDFQIHYKSTLKINSKIYIFFFL